MKPLSPLTVLEAAERLRAGAVIAYPTEAVYGLGCDPARETAVDRVLKLKNRKPEAGLILIADRYERFLPFVGPVESEWLERARSSWPGPITWLFPRAPHVPDWLAGSHPTIALRIPDHSVCRALCAAFGGAIVSTSANPGGERPARSAAAAAGYFGDGIAGVVEGELGGRRQPSEIRDLATGRVLRPSAA